MDEDLCEDVKNIEIDDSECDPKINVPVDASKEWEEVFMEDVEKYIDKHGVSGLEEFFKEKLESWKNVKINIGITGNSGVGKSSFINAIRGLSRDDDNAAKVGIMESTTVPTAYPHPTNEKITFWDLPGMGTPNYPNLETYCKKVELKMFDTFLILATTRFTENNRLLAEKVKSLNKSFFFIRTRIDSDYRSKRRQKSFNEQAMLRKIREDCRKSLQDSEARPDEVFLISSHYPAKWDFGRLTQAILDVLPRHQRECLTFSLSLLTNLSTDMLKRKAALLRGRIWMTAALSGAAGAVPVPGVSIVVDLVLLTNEVSFYKSQFGLPDENSDEFQKMTLESQQNVRMFCSGLQMASLISQYTVGSTIEEFSRFIPFIGSAIAGSISFASTYHFLDQCLQKLESAALDFVKEKASRAARDDFDVE